jgi:hypothetical protein
MTVECETIAQFMNVIALSVAKGLQFDAKAETYTIVYTGGY